MELFPAYLLAAEANAGVGRANAAEDFLGLARWLALGNPERVGDEALARMHELFGDLRSSQRRMDEAAAAFAEETYHRASAYGPEDVRTTFGYLRLARCFERTGDHGKCVAFCRTVCDVWLEATVASNAGRRAGRGSQTDAGDHAPNAPLPLRRKQTLEGVDVADVGAGRADERGLGEGTDPPWDDAVCAADASLAAGCALLGLVAEPGVRTRRRRWRGRRRWWRRRSASTRRRRPSGWAWRSGRWRRRPRRWTVSRTAMDGREGRQFLT